MMLHYKQTLLQLASQADRGDMPAPCPVPRQWLPSFIRFPIRILLLPFVLLDLCMQRLARKIIRPPYTIQGGCKKRGACCHYILMMKFPPPLSWIFHFWHTQINGFYRRSKRLYYSNGKPVFVYGCRYLMKDGRCQHYRTRPMICRKYPYSNSFVPSGTMKGCGFKSSPRQP